MPGWNPIRSMRRFFIRRPLRPRPAGQHAESTVNFQFFARVGKIEVPLHPFDAEFLCFEYNALAVVTGFFNSYTINQTPCPASRTFPTDD